MIPSSRKVEPETGLQSLYVSTTFLLILVAAPHALLERTLGAHSMGQLVSGVRLWLMCLAACFTLNGLIEIAVQRPIRWAWVHIVLWSAVIPVAYVCLVREFERRWAGIGESFVYALSAVGLVAAFAAAILHRLVRSVKQTAQFDHLTGLPNRMQLSSKLNLGIEEARRMKQKMAVCMFNIDRFKRVNDSLGHGGGDAVLLHVAKQLKQAAHAGHIVARIGGDEFVVVMPDVGSMEAAERYVCDLTAALNRPVIVGSREVCVTASLGICLYPDFADDAAGLLHKADAAMYEAKGHGRARQHGYQPVQTKVSADRLEMEEDFRHALRNNELSLHYQPQIELATRDVTGLEALLRWNSPKRGNVPPSDFIQIAEEVGLMIPVGEWALKQACHDCVEIQKAIGRPLTMAVNLSARQFSEEGLPKLIEETLAASGLEPRCLELEITEHMLMVHSPRTVETLQAIRELGVGIAIDDFGTGFSSFAYILQYQVDRIKIDQSFIARSIHDPNATAVVRTIIAMAHGLNMRVVAEGVETVQQSEFLKRRRCDDAQGYLFARPVPKSEVAATVQRIVRELHESRPQERVTIPVSGYTSKSAEQMFPN